MSLSIGIVGLPNVGKSSLFNALTSSKVLAANYPFATIEPNTGIVALADKRLDNLAKLYGSNKIIPATITFTDIAGLVAGASKGEGLGNQFLSHIRSCNAIVEVVRAFDDPNVTHVDPNHSPQKDISTIATELALADIASLQKRLPRLEKEARANPKLMPRLKLAQKVYSLLDSGDGTTDLSHVLDNSPNEDALWFKEEFQLLSLKPIIYLFNLGDDDLGNDDLKTSLMKLVKPHKALFVSAKLESELIDLDPSEAAELLASYGQDESGLVKLTLAAYDLLGLQSFLTAGPKEVRAWTIKQGSTAPEAAGVIHSDFQRGFIAAQIIDYDELVAAGSEVAARSAGKIRTEGKNYVMQPGDIVDFKFNVSS